MRVDGVCLACSRRSSVDIESYWEMDRLTHGKLTWACPSCDAEVVGDVDSPGALLSGRMKQHPVGRFRRKLLGDVNELEAHFNELDLLDLDIVLDDLAGAMNDVEAMQRRAVELAYERNEKQ